jgi:TusA-related sulfurtransferase
MRIKQKLKLKGLLDPFTLLKFSQAYREIQAGDQLEILYEGSDLPEELFKVMPVGGFVVISEQALENDALFRIVLEKKSTPAVETTIGGCNCQ